MIVIDIGNTDIVIGIYTNNKLDKILRFNTKTKKTIELIKSRFTNQYIHRLKIKYKICILSSVVPEINNKILSLFKSLKFKVLNININNIPFDVQFNYQSKELGSDRIANTLAAIQKYGKNCLIIDFGTATTFDVIKNNKYEGGVIAPGIDISHNALVRHASKLKKISIIRTKSLIGNNTNIAPNVCIHNDTIIGDNVIIESGTVIGSDGFGYTRSQNKTFEHFPHVGGVIIEDDVYVGANACIDRGTLDDTIIRKGAKIDNLVHIAHNVIVGKHTAVIALAMLGGSVHTGDYSWIAPSASVMNQAKLGENVTVGLGATVMKNVPDGQTVVGIPARPIKEFVKIQRQLEKKSKA